MEAANEYLYLILSVIALIVGLVEARLKLGAMSRKLDQINGTVTRHENWIHRAIGKWGGPDYQNHGR